MAIPVVVAYISSSSGWVKNTSTSASAVPYNINLSASVISGTPVSKFEWSVSPIPSSSFNLGGYPSGSSIAVGAVGNFTNGLSNTESPTCTLDVTGGYCFSVRAYNTDGWSLPSENTTGSQAIIYSLTSGSIKLPPENMYNYANDLNESLYKVSLKSLTPISSSKLTGDQTPAASDWRYITGLDLTSSATINNNSVLWVGWNIMETFNAVCTQELAILVNNTEPKKIISLIAAPAGYSQTSNGLYPISNLPVSSSHYVSFWAWSENSITIKGGTVIVGRTSIPLTSSAYCFVTN